MLALSFGECSVQIMPNLFGLFSFELIIFVISCLLGCLSSRTIFLNRYSSLLVSLILTKLGTHDVPIHKKTC